VQARKAAQRVDAQPAVAKRTHTSEQQQQQQQQYDSALCCMLCRRAFKSAEALQTHITQSELHLINEQLLGFGLDVQPQLKRAKVTAASTTDTATATAAVASDSTATAGTTTIDNTAAAGAGAASADAVITYSSAVK
jgi:hypothetical protein